VAEQMDQNGDQDQKQNWPLRQWSRLRGARWRDVIIGQVGEGATNVVIGKNNIQINVGGRNLALPIWLITLALVAIIGFLAYKPLIEPWLHPSQMNAAFNIAVAEFGAIDQHGGVHGLPFGATLSKAVYDKLMAEYQGHYPELMGKKDGVLIWEDSLGRAAKNVHFGVITGATPAARARQAERLAKRINANLVIYGYLEPNSTGADELTLEFYVAGETVRGEPDAISGRHLLGQGVLVPIDAKKEAMSAALWLSDGPLAARSQLIFWLTLGLTYETLNQPEKALALFENAKEVLKLDPKDGAALLEYFIGREAFWLRRYDTAIAALERSQSLDPTYANAGITLANVYYDRAQLFYLPKPPPPALAECVSEEQLANAAPTAADATGDIELAISKLGEALQMADRPPKQPIAAVGHLSLGNAYRLKGQSYLLAQPRDLEAAEAGFNSALPEFQTALQSFTENHQERYMAWTHLGIAATHLLQAFVPLQQITPGEDPATANPKKQASVRLFQLAAAEAQQCIKLSKDVGDLAYRQKVLDCGCVYYAQHAGELAAQVQKTIKEEK
jgi:tetratricopeptide (TPR) repeat protein